MQALVGEGGGAPSVSVAVAEVLAVWARLSRLLREREMLGRERKGGGAAQEGRGSDCWHAIATERGEHACRRKGVQGSWKLNAWLVVQQTEEWESFWCCVVAGAAGVHGRGGLAKNWLQGCSRRRPAGAGLALHPCSAKHGLVAEFQQLSGRALPVLLRSLPACTQTHTQQLQNGLAGCWASAARRRGGWLLQNCCWLMLGACYWRAREH